MPYCANGYAQECPRPDCIGVGDVYACKFIQRINAWRELGEEAQIAKLASPTDAKILAAVRECPDRGSTLPPAEQMDCGCAELTYCAANKGAVPGRVTLRDCMDCRTVALSGPAD